MIYFTVIIIVLIFIIYNWHLLLTLILLIYYNNNYYYIDYYYNYYTSLGQMNLPLSGLVHYLSSTNYPLHTTHGEKGALSFAKGWQHPTAETGMRPRLLDPDAHASALYHVLSPAGSTSTVLGQMSAGAQVCRAYDALAHLAGMQNMCKGRVNNTARKVGRGQWDVSNSLGIWGLI